MYKKICNHLVANQYTWLITGVAGFIGSNILEKLLLLDQKVIGLDDFSTGHQKNLNEVMDLVSKSQWKNFSFISGDIQNLKDCQTACKSIDYVLHHAALGSVPLSIENPNLCNSININGFLNMLIASRDNNIKRFVFAASSSTYGEHPTSPKVEDEIGAPLSPYGVTKLVNELYADVFNKNYGLSYVGLRYFNVFGKRQDPYGPYAAVIPKWIAALIKEGQLTIYGDGKTTRDFCYVDNVVQANILSALVKDSNSLNQIYNIAMQESTSLNQLHELISQILSQHDLNITKNIIHEDFRLGDIKHSLACIEKASHLLGYKPTHNVMEGMEEAMSWYINNLSV